MNENIIRGFIFTQGAFVFIITIAIVIRYAMKLALTKQEDRALPWHIMLISLSYLTAVIFICIELRMRWGLPMTYRVPLAAFIFILGDAALIFMLSHLFVQRKMVDEIHDHAAEKLEEEKRELAAELRKQTSGLAQMIKGAGEKADEAYHEANAVNEKIASLREEVSDKLSDIKTDAETARVKASDVSDKADLIGETGKDTNTRVRHIQENK